MSKLDKNSYLIAFFATIVRYYDYALFGLSASAISDNFMPDGSKTDKLLNFFIIFSISVAARPLGSIIFGQISDKIGRVASVKITTIIAACSSILIGFLPSYGMIGFAATVVLMCLRMIFIMSLAGEVDAIKIYVSEKIGSKYRHFANGLVSFSAQVGVLIAAFAYHFTSNFSNIEWLWRANFILGGMFGIVIFMLRNRLKEIKYYQKKTDYKNNELIQINLLNIIKKNRLKFVLSVILSGVIGASYNFWLIFLSTFTSNVSDFISKADASKYNTILIAVYAFSSLISGFLADRFKLIWKQIFITLLLFLCLLILIQYLSFYQKFSFFSHIIAVSLVPIYAIPIQIKLQSIFSVDIRVRMCSLSHSIGSMLFSSTIPAFCMFLWKYTKFMPIVYMYFTLLLLFMILALLVLRHESYKNMFDR